MSLAGDFWNKICVPLDGFLWHRNISHPIIRPLVRNEILASGLFILAGAAFYAVFPWLFWFGCGLACITWIFWGWARFFLRLDLSNYGAALMRAVFITFGLRLIVLAILLYIALALLDAPIMAITAGFIAGSVLALLSYALNMKNL